MPRSNGRDLQPLLIILVMLLAACSSASQPASSTAAPIPSVAAPPAASAIVLGNEQAPVIPAVQRELERRQAALAASPYILLRPGLEGRLGAAQEAVVNDGRALRKRRAGNAC
jgi:hypothetical protein